MTIISFTWKLNNALATILQSEGFLPALRKPAWLPLLSSSYLMEDVEWFWFKKFDSAQPVMRDGRLLVGEQRVVMLPALQVHPQLGLLGLVDALVEIVELRLNT